MVTRKIVLLTASLFICWSNTHAQVRKCAACGGFYASDPAKLSTEVAGYLQSAASPVKTEGLIYGIIAPHAGYQYSGKIAAEAYSRLKDNYDTVVIIGVAHRVAVKAAALTKGVFETPLGNVLVDDKLADKLLSDKKLFELSAEAHAMEHSVETQLPFLIKKLKKPFKILPIVMNTGDYETAAQVGLALGRALKGRIALIVVSTDFSHYPSASLARKSDTTALAAIETMDSSYFALTNAVLLASRPVGLECVSCGVAAIIAGMEVVKELGANRAYTLKYSNSGELTGEKDRSVGYGSVVFSSAKIPAEQKWNLSGKEKTNLIMAAKTAIAANFDNKQIPPDLSEYAQLNLPAAVFVTITKNGELRGCIGTTEPRGSLLNSVQYFARGAAFNDNRFPSVERIELPELRYEISILSQPKFVRSHHDIKSGTDGVIVEKDGHSGLFLPQVWKQLPLRTKFLSELCAQKAGLPPDCWQDPKTKIYVFNVYSFQ